MSENTKVLVSSSSTLQNKIVKTLVGESTEGIKSGITVFGDGPCNSNEKHSKNYKLKELKINNKNEIECDICKEKYKVNQIETTSLIEAKKNVYFLI